MARKTLKERVLDRTILSLPDLISDPIDARSLMLALCDKATLAGQLFDAIMAAVEVELEKEKKEQYLT